MTKGEDIISDNVIRVNFNQKDPKKVNMKTLYPDAFAMYIDTQSENPDKFSRAVLDALGKEAAVLSGNHGDETTKEPDNPK